MPEECSHFMNVLAQFVFFAILGLKGFSESKSAVQDAKYKIRHNNGIRMPWLILTFGLFHCFWVHFLQHCNHHRFDDVKELNVRHNAHDMLL